MFSLEDMYQIEVVRNRFTDEEIQVLKKKYLDDILINSEFLSKNQILEKIRNLRDLLDRLS